VFPNLSRCFDLGDGITFDDTTGILYGTTVPALEVGAVPASTLYIQTTPPTLWQLSDTGWVSFGASALPQNVLDVATRLADIRVSSPSGVLFSATDSLASSEAVVSWAGRHVEGGDTMPVAYKMQGDAGHLITGKLTHVSMHGSISSSGVIDLEDDTGTLVSLALSVSGRATYNIAQNVSGVLRIKLKGSLDADTLYIDAYYRRAL